MNPVERSFDNAADIEVTVERIEIGLLVEQISLGQSMVSGKRSYLKLYLHFVFTKYAPEECILSFCYFQI